MLCSAISIKNLLELSGNLKQLIHINKNDTRSLSNAMCKLKSQLSIEVCMCLAYFDQSTVIFEFYQLSTGIVK